MKRFLIILFIVTSISYGQTEYNFDYMLHYKHTNHVDSTKSKTIYFLTNSKDNSYSARIINKDSLNFNVHFYKYDLFISDVVISKKNFKMAEFIGIDCKNLRPSSNPYKYKVKDYDYVKLESQDSLEIYEIKNIKPKKDIKIKNTATYVFKFNTSHPFHLPNLYEATPYEEWNVERDLPNNFISELLVYNSKNELISSEILSEYIQIDKKIKIITDECGSLFLENIIKIK